MVCGVACPAMPISAEYQEWAFGVEKNKEVHRRHANAMRRGNRDKREHQTRSRVIKKPEWKSSADRRASSQEDITEQAPWRMRVVERRQSRHRRHFRHQQPPYSKLSYFPSSATAAPSNKQMTDALHIRPREQRTSNRPKPGVHE